jgi:hypothetical protein
MRFPVVSIGTGTPSIAVRISVESSNWIEWAGHGNVTRRVDNEASRAAALARVPKAVRHDARKHRIASHRGRDKFGCVVFILLKDRTNAVNG